MRFEVTFVAEAETFSVSVPEEEVGLADIKRIRKLFWDKIPLKWINAKIKSLSAAPNITLNYEQAKESGHYLCRNKVKVETTGQNLNPFVYHVPYVDFSKVPPFGIKQELNEQEVLKAWKQAGYPLEWEVKPEDYIAE